MSHDFFYRPWNFHVNILRSFEIIAKTLLVALEVSSIYCIHVKLFQPFLKMFDKSIILCGFGKESYLN